MFDAPVKNPYATRKDETIDFHRSRRAANAQAEHNTKGNGKNNKSQKKRLSRSNMVGINMATAPMPMQEDGSISEKEDEAVDSALNQKYESLFGASGGSKNSKLSSSKLAMKQKHRNKMATKKIHDLQSQLKSIGIDPMGMSMMKMRNTLDRYYEKLGMKSEEKEEKQEDDEKKDPLAFLVENDLLSFAKGERDDFDPILKDENNDGEDGSKQNENRKGKRKHGMRLDLEFGDIVKGDYEQEKEELTFLQTGKRNREIYGKKMLKKLKNRERLVTQMEREKGYFMDQHAVNVAMAKCRGEKPEVEYKTLKEKMNLKHKKKLRSQRSWNARLKRKNYGKKQKATRKSNNIIAYRQGKVAKKIGKRISDQTAIKLGSLK